MKAVAIRARPAGRSGSAAPAPHSEEVIDVIQLSTYDALPGRMTDDAARAARRRLVLGGRRATPRTLLAMLRGTARRRAAELRRAA